MPIYQYTDGDTLVELIRTVADRDICPVLPGRGKFRRITVPQRLGIASGAIDPQSPDAAVPRALREYELTKGHDAIARETGFSTRRMKGIWGI